MTRPYQPWDPDQIREVARLRRCGCDVYTIAQMMGLEHSRVERLFFTHPNDENSTAPSEVAVS